MKKARASKRPSGSGSIIEMVKTILAEERNRSIFIKRGELELSISVR